MSAADSLNDALRETELCRDALARGDLGAALIYYTFANRHHALALATKAILDHASPPSDFAMDVDNAIKLAKDAILSLARPPSASPVDVVMAVRDGLAPILRELATPGADPEMVVRARAANVAAALLGNFDIRKLGH